MERESVCEWVWESAHTAKFNGKSNSKWERETEREEDEEK